MQQVRQPSALAEYRGLCNDYLQLPAGQKAAADGQAGAECFAPKTEGFGDAMTPSRILAINVLEWPNRLIRGQAGVLCQHALHLLRGPGCHLKAPA